MTSPTPTLIERLRACAEAMRTENPKREYNLVMPHTHWLTEAADALEAKDREVAELESVLIRISISDVPRSDGKQWRTDGAYSKLDQCGHGVPMYEDCTGCIEDFARAAIKDQPA